MEGVEKNRFINVTTNKYNITIVLGGKGDNDLVKHILVHHN